MRSNAHGFAIILKVAFLRSYQNFCIIKDIQNIFACDIEGDVNDKS